MLTYKFGRMYLYNKKKERFNFSSKTDYRKFKLINKTATQKNLEVNLKLKQLNLS